MLLSKLLEKIDYRCLQGNTDIEIEDVIYDSRKVSKDTAFVCISGTVLDSHDFIPDAIKKGATAIIVEKEVKVEGNVTVILVPSTRKALSYMACAYFDYPAEKLVMIGLTGTKGKTTTTYMIQAILERAGKSVGVIGTIGAVIKGTAIKTANTTPESYELQSLFRKMVDAGVTHCVMEVSSQGLKMDRVAGIMFDYGVFTNFSPDHIGKGEHESLEEYLYCKSLLFKQCKVGLINIDDPNHVGVTKDHTCTLQTFGMKTSADLCASNLEYLSSPGFLGVSFDVSGMMEGKVVTAIPGKFSVYNSLVSLMVCKNLGIPEACMIEALRKIHVSGRVEIVPVSDKFTVMIDYAHNAMSVESLLSTIRSYEPKRVVCVFGCGGNRSKFRRYDMGELCGKMADLCILTSDNPRDEEVSDINEDIKVGLAKSNGTYIEIEDRKEAVFYSMDHAQDGDIIILLGKGHESYQEIKGVKHHYNERETVLSYKANRNK